MRTATQATIAAALLAGMFTPPVLAQSSTGTVAYPRNPSGTPAATDGGASIATRAPCETVACPDKPGAPDHAGDTAGHDQKAGVRTPTAAYPVGAPGAAANGSAPK